MIDFRPSQDFAVMSSRAKNDLQKWHQVRGAHLFLKLESWAGDLLHSMQQSRAITLQSLDSENENIRIAATALLAEYWPPNECFAAAVLRMAFNEPVPAIRGAALSALRLMQKYVEDDPAGTLCRLLKEIFPSRPTDQQLAGELKQQIAESQRQTEAAKKKSWEDAAGAEAGRLQESREIAESYLTHPEPRIRRATLLALEMFWLSPGQLSEVCQRLAIEDSDPSVQSLAIVLLSGCFMHTDDKRIGEFVARFARNPIHSDEIRRAAYLALFGIRGLPAGAFLEADQQRFPEEADWRFVDSFLNPEE